MVRDRYDPIDLFALIPALNLTMDPVLAPLAQLLEDDALVQRVNRPVAPSPPHRHPWAPLHAGRGADAALSRERLGGQWSLEWRRLPRRIASGKPASKGYRYMGYDDSHV
jgi:hypothetical protein